MDDARGSLAAVSDESGANPKRILVVDDEEDVQVLVCRILRDVGYEVDSASEGGEAIEKIALQRPDLLVLDLMMPGIDGWGVLDHLHGVEDAPPVVVVTARSDYASFTRGVKEGAAAWVFKPFRFHELVATCQKILLTGPRRPAVKEERRKSPRRALVVDVEVLSRERAPVAVGELVNIGLGGAQVDLGVPLETGDAVRIAFHSPSGGFSLSLKGEVRWRGSAPRGYSHGLVFKDLSPDAEKALAELLRPSG
jgi:CheY-like chemotaxis protein